MGHSIGCNSTNTPIPPQLKAGGVLKFSPRTQRFFIIQHSREIPVDQAQARRLATSSHVRPNGVDSHGLFVFALTDKRGSKP